MSGNYARRGGGNPNSRKSSCQEKKAHKNSKYSDNSSSDELQDTTQKHSRIINQDTMDEDFVANTTADDSLDGTDTTTIPQQNNSHSTSQKNTQALPPKNSAAPT